MKPIEFNCPGCGSRVRMETPDGGGLQPCPRCRQWVRVPATSVYSSGPAPDGSRPSDETVGAEAAAPMAVSTVRRPVESGRAESRRGTAAGGGWSCLILGLLLMLVAREASYVYLPIIAVAFVLGIVAMAQGRAMSGQLLLICSLVVPAFLAVNVLRVDITRFPWRPVAEDPGSASPPAPGSPAEPVPATGAALEDPGAGVADEGAAEFVMVDTPDGVPLEDPPDVPPPSDWDEDAPRPEPDWEARHDHWFGQYSSRFVVPQSGVFVKLRLRSGSTVEGLLHDVRPQELSIQIPNGWMRVERSRLSDETRRAFFREDFARYHASRRVRDEKQRWAGW